MTKNKFTGRIALFLNLMGLLLFFGALNARASQQPDPQIPNQQAPDQQLSNPQVSDQQANSPANMQTNDQDQANAQANQADPPSRVARVSVLDGNISFQPSGSQDWGTAALNRPVTIGDKIWSDQDSRAELQAGQASIHIGNMTALSFLNLDEAVTQMRVAEGAINFRVRELRQGDVYEVDTPNIAFLVKEAGEFRIDVNENGDASRVTVVRGAGEVTAAGKAYPVKPGESAEFTGTDNVQYNTSPAVPADDLDHWAEQRDLRDENSVSAQYVSRDVPGYSDLDDNGTWSEQPDYGPVWYPNGVDVGWAPYSYGYWSYIGPWGWTWVDYAPWGFAPFHYGRWAYIGGRWGWCPGPYVAAPFYGPAFVGFLGGGFGVGVGFGFGFGIGGGVGWFPLGFREPFHPWYHTSAVYVRNVNVTNTRFAGNFNFNNSHNFNYAYAHNANAVTATSRTGFAGGQAVNRSAGAAHFSEASLRGAQVTNGAAGVSPTRQSYLGAANMRGNVSHPPASVQNRSIGGNASAAAHGNSGSATGGFNSSHQNQPSQNRPASSATGGRTWSAQGNETTSGHAPQGFGSSEKTPANGSATVAGRAHSDRPAWAGSHPGGASTTSGTRTPTYGTRTPSSAGTSARTTTPSTTHRGSSSPRTYTPQTRSTPSHSSASHSSGGSSHGGGGGSHHPR